MIKGLRKLLGSDLSDDDSYRPPLPTGARPATFNPNTGLFSTQPDFPRFALPPEEQARARPASTTAARSLPPLNPPHARQGEAAAYATAAAVVPLAREPLAPRTENRMTLGAFTSFLIGKGKGRPTSADKHARTLRSTAELQRSASAPNIRLLPPTVSQWVEAHYPEAAFTGVRVEDERAEAPRLTDIFPKFDIDGRPQAPAPVPLPSGTKADACAAVDNTRQVGAELIAALEPPLPLAGSRFMHEQVAQLGPTSHRPAVDPLATSYQKPFARETRLLLWAVQRWRPHPMCPAWSWWRALCAARMAGAARAAAHWRGKELTAAFGAWRDDAATRSTMRRIVLRMRHLTVANAFTTWRYARADVAANKDRLMRKVLVSWTTGIHRAFYAWAEFTRDPGPAPLAAPQVAWELEAAAAVAEATAAWSPPIDHEEGLLFQDWDTSPASRAQVGVVRDVSAPMVCHACDTPIAFGDAVVYHMEGRRFHLPCFPAAVAAGVQTLSFEKMATAVMEQADKVFRIKEYFASDNRGYAYTAGGTYINVILA